MSDDDKQADSGFENDLNKLEALVEKMEAGDISLEDSLKAFEEGIRLTRKAQQALAEAEQKVQVLLERDDEPVSTDFEPEAGE